MENTMSTSEKDSLGHVAHHFIQSEFDFWLNDVKNHRSFEFSKQARSSGGFAAKFFDNVYEYEMWRDFNSFDGHISIEDYAMNIPDIQKSY